MKASRLLSVKLGPRLVAAVAGAAEAKAKSNDAGLSMAARQPPQGIPDGQHRRRHIQQQSAGIASFISNCEREELRTTVVSKGVPRTIGEKHTSFLHFISSSTHQKKNPHKNASYAQDCDNNEALMLIKELPQSIQKKPPLRVAIGRTRREGRIVTLSNDGAEKEGVEVSRIESEARTTRRSPNVSLSEVEDLVSNVLMRRATRDSTSNSEKEEKPESRNNGEKDSDDASNCVLLLPKVFPSAKYVGLVACGVSSAALVDAVVGMDVGKSRLSSADFHIGVNFAVHRLVNASPRLSSSSSPPSLSFSSPQSSSSSVMIEGLLKGCAEQNALGAFAARGLEPFTAVRTVVLFGRHIEIGDRGNKDNNNVADDNDDRSVVTENCSSCCSCGESTANCKTLMSAGNTSVGRSSALKGDAESSSKGEQMAAHTTTTIATVTRGPWWVSMFPCGQCWSHLCEIWRAQRGNGNNASALFSSTPGSSRSSLLTLVISINSIEEVDLLRHTLSLAFNNYTRRKEVEIKDGEGSNSRTEGSSDMDVKAQWFIKRHAHLLPALMRPSTCVVIGCGGGAEHVKEPLFMPSTLAHEPSKRVLPRDTTSALTREGEGVEGGHGREDNCGPRIILLVQWS